MAGGWIALQSCSPPLRIRMRCMAQDPALQSEFNILKLVPMQLAGRACLALRHPRDVLEIAPARIAQGARACSSPARAVMGGGGGKGLVLADDYEAKRSVRSSSASRASTTAYRNDFEQN